ncbi:MAG: TolC family protein [Bacteroidetes bacterium]|nr:TolC family protein [Bacteroidota bacterium]
MTIWKMIVSVCLLVCVMSTCYLSAQESLSLESAIRIGLENNYSIRISKNDTQIAENNVSVGNAGMLPRLDATASEGGTITNVNQELTSGQTIDKIGATSMAFNAGIALTWTLFDGFKMFASYDRFQEIQRIGNLIFRRTVENTLSQIISQYYDVIAQRNSLETFQEAVYVSQRRFDVAKNRNELGASSQQRLLQATIDFNEDRAVFLRQKATLQRSKITLNQLLARNADIEFEPSDSIALKPKFIIEDLREKSFIDNTSLLIAKSNKLLAENDLKLLNADWYPTLSFSSGLNYAKTNSQFGAVMSARTLGFNYGITASINLFEGGNLSRKSENTRLLVLSNEYNIALVKEQVSADVSRMYKQYITAIELVQLETENALLTKQNVDISLERYKLGNMNEFEFRQAQKTMVDAENRTIKSLYEAKIAETELLRLSGALVNP